MLDTVTIAEVKLLLGETELTDDEMTAYITSSNVMLDNILGEAELPSTLMLEMEKWLCCHLITTARQRQSTKELAGSAEVRYSDIFGQNLLSTTFGQTLVVMDPTGTLLTLASNKKFVNVFAVPGSGGPTSGNHIIC